MPIKTWSPIFYHPFDKNPPVLCKCPRCIRKHARCVRKHARCVRKHARNHRYLKQRTLVLCLKSGRVPAWPAAMEECPPGPPKWKSAITTNILPNFGRVRLKVQLRPNSTRESIIQAKKSFGCLSRKQVTVKNGAEIGETMCCKLYPCCYCVKVRTGVLVSKFCLICCNVKN